MLVEVPEQNYLRSIQSIPRVLVEEVVLAYLPEQNYLRSRKPLPRVMVSAVSAVCTWYEALLQRRQRRGTAEAEERGEQKRER